MYYGNGHVDCINDNKMLFLLQLKLTELLQLLTRHSTSWPFLKVFLVFSEVSKNCKILQRNWQQNTLNEYLRIDKENNSFFHHRYFCHRSFDHKSFHHNISNTDLSVKDEQQKMRMMEISGSDSPRVPRLP